MTTIMSGRGKRQVPTKPGIISPHRHKMWHLRKSRFMKEKIAENIQAGHVDNFPWEDVKYLQVLWISQLAPIPQLERTPILIYDFYWIRVSEKVKQAVPKEAMGFGRALH